MAIIGGGIIGLSCAWQLAKRGAHVVVFEQGELGSRSTRAAAGMVAPLAEAAFESPSPETLGADTDTDRSDRFLEACRASRDLWRSWHPELEATTGQSIEYDRSGTLFLAFDSEQSAALDRLEALALRLGEPSDRPGVGDLLLDVPDLGSDLEARLTGALRLGGEHRIHGVEAAAALARAAASIGAELRPHRPAERVRALGEGIEIESADTRRRFDAAIVCAGAWSGAIADLPPLPVRPVRGQMLQLDGIDWPWRGALRVPGPHYAVRRGGHRLLVGATVEEAGYDDRTTEAGRRALLEFSRRLLPDLEIDAPVASWSGLRPATPDRLPVLGRLDERPLYYATGHYRNGILLAPWTAETIARWLLDPTCEPADHPFTPRRIARLEAGSSACTERL